MSANFSITLKLQHALVHVEMGGFFSEADVALFAADMISKIHALDCAPNEHLTLCDISAMKIQSQDSVTAFAQFVGHPQVRSRKLAVVTGATLARQQAIRLTDRPGVRFFRDVPSAEAWLLSDQD